MLLERMPTIDVASFQFDSKFKSGTRKLTAIRKVTDGGIDAKVCAYHFPINMRVGGIIPKCP